MIEFPENVRSIVKKATAKHLADIQKATSEAEKQIRKLKEFDGLANLLVTSAVQEMVYDIRHQMNTEIKNQEGREGGKTKVKSSSDAVKAVYESSYFNLFIGGSILGMLTGGELVDVASSERAIAAGYTFNADLALELSRIVPEDKTVRQSVSSKKLDAIAKRIKKQP